MMTDRVNAWIDSLDDVNCYIFNIEPFMSYAGDKGYMIGCMVRYFEKVEDEIDNDIDPDSVDAIGFNLNFGTKVLNA